MRIKMWVERRGHCSVDQRGAAWRTGCDGWHGRGGRGCLPPAQCGDREVLLVVAPARVATCCRATVVGAGGAVVGDVDRAPCFTHAQLLHLHLAALAAAHPCREGTAVACRESVAGKRDVGDPAVGKGYGVTTFNPYSTSGARPKTRYLPAASGALDDEVAGVAA